MSPGPPCYHAGMEMILLLFLVIDPFGNLPFVLAILRRLSGPAYRRAVIREIAIAFVILLLFAAAGESLFGYLNISQSSLRISGGVILFLISLKMIFQSSEAIFADRYAENPVLVPIAVPSIAGPAAVTTVMILRTQQQASLLDVAIALAVVLAVTVLILLAGRPIKRILGERGILALEKFMGLLLNLVAVNMIMLGLSDWLK